MWLVRFSILLLHGNSGSCAEAIGSLLIEMACISGSRSHDAASKLLRQHFIFFQNSSFLPPPLTGVSQCGAIAKSLQIRSEDLRRTEVECLRPRFASRSPSQMARPPPPPCVTSPRESVKLCDGDIICLGDLNCDMRRAQKVCAPVSQGLHPTRSYAQCRVMSLKSVLGIPSDIG